MHLVTGPAFLQSSDPVVEE